MRSTSACFRASPPSCGPCKSPVSSRTCSAKLRIFEAMSSTPQISIMALMHCSMKRSAFTTFSVRCPVMSWNEQAV
jgi:hypothetical protein